MAHVIEAATTVFIHSHQELHVSLQAQKPVFLIIEQLECLHWVVDQPEGVGMLFLVETNFFNKLLGLFGQAQVKSEHLLLTGLDIHSLLSIQKFTFEHFFNLCPFVDDELRDEAVVLLLSHVLFVLGITSLSTQ